MIRRLINLGMSMVAMMVFTASAFAEIELLMFEEKGCYWCARWKAEVGDAYAGTKEGMAAPLRMLDKHDPLPEEVVLDRRITFTPTFVLVDNGKELERIEGYPGEDFFWGLLNVMLERNKLLGEDVKVN